MLDDQIPTGWYPDPSGDLSLIRYWDGQTWTSYTYAVSATVGFETANPVQPQTWSQAQSQLQSVMQPQPQTQYQPQGQAQYQPQYQPQYQSQQPFQSQTQFLPQPEFAYANPTAGPKSSSCDKFAIAGMVCGIVGIPTCICYIGFIPGILGLVFGILGLKSSKRGMAIAGIICGATAIALVLFLIVLVVTRTVTNTPYGPFDFNSPTDIFESKAY